MMDVLLLALLVTLVKLGDLVSFHLGPAVVAFVLCVVMSMIASIMFDPHAIWEKKVELKLSNTPAPTQPDSQPETPTAVIRTVQQQRQSRLKTKLCVAQWCVCHL
ncbi:MAG: paraquat-inducible protein A [Pirellulales bacterium]